jgi:hypothetical protein
VGQSRMAVVVALLPAVKPVEPNALEMVMLVS